MARFLGWWWVLILCAWSSASPAQPRRRRPQPTPAPSPVVVQPVAPVVTPPPAEPVPVAFTATVPTQPADPSRNGFVLVGALGGFGFANSTHFSAQGNYLAAGVGARVSYTFAAPVRLSVGVEGVYHFGFARTAAPLFSGLEVTHGHRAVYVGGTLGWDIIVGPLIVRPYALAGVTVSAVECRGCIGVAEATEATDGVVGTGLALILTASVVYFGVDARVMAAFQRGQGHVASALYGTLGVRIR